jgi:hypothetical protein
MHGHIFSFFLIESAPHRAQEWKALVAKLLESAKAEGAKSFKIR